MISDLPAPLTGDPLSILAETLKEQGRHLSEFWTNMFAAWHVYPDDAFAYSEARRWLLFARNLSSLGSSIFFDRTPRPISSWRARLPLSTRLRKQRDTVEGVSDTLLNKMVDELTFVGDLSSMERQNEHLAAYKERGFNRCCTSPISRRRNLIAPDSGICTTGPRIGATPMIKRGYMSTPQGGSCTCESQGQART